MDGDDPGVWRSSVWGTGLCLVVTNPAVLEQARELLVDELNAAEAATSRFSQASELMERCASGGGSISEVLMDYLLAARRGYLLSQGLVDPCVGASLIALGYDRDFDAIDPASTPILPVVPPPFSEVSIDVERSSCTIPAGTILDLGATAKAHCADRAARKITTLLDTGALVEIGGDLSIAGPVPEGGHIVGIVESARKFGEVPQVSVTLAGGGMATSSSVVRVWAKGGARLHHLINPLTGRPAKTPWRQVTVAAGSCLDANVAATAAHLQGDDAPQLLAQAGLGARLVDSTGEVLEVGTWPKAES